MKEQETFEEAASEYVDSIKNKIDSYCYCDIQEGFQKGAKWQAERMYSEEETIQLLIKFNQEIQEVENVRDWFEQFKKK